MMDKSAVLVIRKWSLVGFPDLTDYIALSYFPFCMRFHPSLQLWSMLTMNSSSLKKSLNRIEVLQENSAVWGLLRKREWKVVWNMKRVCLLVYLSLHCGKQPVVNWIYLFVSSGQHLYRETSVGTWIAISDYKKLKKIFFLPKSCAWVMEKEVNVPGTIIILDCMSSGLLSW